MLEGRTALESCTVYTHEVYSVCCRVTLYTADIVQATNVGVAIKGAHQKTAMQTIDSVEPSHIHLRENRY